MTSKEAWIFANKYSSNLLFNCAIVTVAIQILLFVSLGAHTALISTLILWILMLFGTIIQTEIKLKRFNVA
jgi:hypothetical protein